MATLSRRQLLQAGLLGAVSVVLGACGLGRSETPRPSGPAPVGGSPPAGGTPISSGAPAATPAPGAANAPSAAFLEVLGRPTDRSITANVLPAKAGDIVVEYGTAPGAYTARTAARNAAAGIPAEILIDGLAPNTRYWWRVRDGATTGPEHAFVTQRTAGSTFLFEVQGDSHPERVGKMFDADLYARTLRGAGLSLRTVAGELARRGLCSRTGRAFAAAQIARMTAA